MSKLTGSTGAAGKTALYQIRIQATAPVVIDSKESVFDQWESVLKRCYQQARRASYNVNGPNSEVWWAIDRWSVKRQEWVNLVNGRSKLTEGAGPVWSGRPLQR